MNEELFLKFIKIANNKELDILSYFIANIETTITSEEDKDNLYYFLLVLDYIFCICPNVGDCLYGYLFHTNFHI